MKPSLPLAARTLFCILGAGLYLGQCADAWAATDTCKRHGPVTSDCSYCLDGDVRVGNGTAVTFRWTNHTGTDVVIRQSGGLKLQIAPGQPGAQVGTTSDFGGVFVDSVLWLPLPGHGSVFAVLDGTKPDLLDTRGAFVLTDLLPGFDAALPAVVLKVSVEQAYYDFQTRQAGPFRTSTQCAVFYKVAPR